MLRKGTNRNLAVVPVGVIVEGMYRALRSDSRDRLRERAMRREELRRERRQQLAQLSCFSQLSPQLIDELALYTQTKVRHAEELLVRSGDPADALFAIVEGQAQVQVPECRRSAPIHLQAGQIFGEACILQLSRRNANVVSRGKMLTIQCSAAEIRRLMQLHGELRDALWQLLSRRRLANFAGSAWLEGLGPEERRELLRYCRVSRVLRGACVQRKGRPVEQLWIPLSGALVGESGRGGSTAIGPGSVYGGRTLGAATASDLRVTAKVDMLCIRIPKSDYACIEQQFPQFARRLEAAARLV